MSNARILADLMGTSTTVPSSKLSLAGSDLPSGTVLQVQSATQTSATTMSNSSYADVAGLSVSITPSSASSKILVLVNIHINAANSVGVVWKIVRDTTDIAVNNTTAAVSTGGHYSESGANAGNVWSGKSISHLDTPNTTSSVTYKIQAHGTSTTSFGINRRSNYNDYGGVSSITVMEIAG